MDRSKDYEEGSLFFMAKKDSKCQIRVMTIFHENVIIDAQFGGFSRIMKQEWKLGEKGAIKITAAERGVLKEFMVYYCLQKGQVHVKAAWPSSLSTLTISSIASQFFIRKGNTLQFLSVRSRTSEKNSD